MKTIFYLNDNEINIIKKEIKTFSLHSLANNNVINITNFINEVKPILNHLKINKGIIGEDALVYINYPITEMNNLFFTELFSNLGFNNIEIRSINLILNERNTIYLIINKNSQFLLFNNTYHDLTSIEDLYSFTLKNKIKILGTNKNIFEIKDILKTKLNNEIYVYYPPDKYILEKIGKIM